MVQQKRDKRVVILLTAAELEFINQKSGEAPADYLRQLALHYSGFDDEVRRHLYRIGQIVFTHVGAISAAYRNTAPDALIEALLELASAAQSLQQQALLDELPTDIEHYLQGRLSVVRYPVELDETRCA